VFFDELDYRYYRKCLRDACARYGCSVHAYVLMTNHVHLLISPATADALPRAMQSLGRRYVCFINARRARTGSLWEGRYRPAAIDTDEYFFTCSRYIELNPVRAGMVEHPRDYPWSSFGANALGRPDPLVTPHALYRAQGATQAERCAAYRHLFDAEIDAATLQALREATQKGWPLGGARFRVALEKTTGRRARPRQKGGTRQGSGRPRGQRAAAPAASRKSIVSGTIDSIDF
jgi:putative transposase